MAGLRWMTVTVGLLLLTGVCLAAVDQNQLATLVKGILNKYTPSYEGCRGGRRYPMFSLAVSIPYNTERKMFDISQVTDDADNVTKTILNCEVFTSTRMVAATVLRWPNVVDQCPEGRVQWKQVLTKCPRGVETWSDVNEKCPRAVKDGSADHAEYRTLQHFNTLVNNHNKTDLLLFYVLASPCDQRCTSKSSPRSILPLINQILMWDNYAVVFSNIFRPRDGPPIPEQDLRGALERLGDVKLRQRSLRLSNIYRCNNRQRKMQCRSCSSGNKVARYCFSDKS